MKYLDCIVLLDTMLTQLCDGTRVKIPVSRIPALQVNLSEVMKKSEDLGIAWLPLQIQDVTIPLDEIAKTKDADYLQADTQAQLCSAIRELRLGIARCACSYYKVNDFTPTPQIIDIMRKTVLLAHGEI